MIVVVIHIIAIRIASVVKIIKQSVNLNLAIVILIYVKTYNIIAMNYV